MIGPSDPAGELKFLSPNKKITPGRGSPQWLTPACPPQCCGNNCCVAVHVLSRLRGIWRREAAGKRRGSIVSKSRPHPIFQVPSSSPWHRPSSSVAAPPAIRGRPSKSGKRACCRFTILVSNPRCIPSVLFFYSRKVQKKVLIALFFRNQRWIIYTVYLYFI